MTIPDWRHIRNGSEIPTEHYSDQPYVVKTDDGAWLCAVTTGAGREGSRGQHIVTLRSTDCGRSWDTPVPVEPADGPEASYAVLLKVPTGRVYCLYNHNTDNVREITGDPASAPDMVFGRVDSLGHYVFKYSDDHGRTWSADRFDIPVREFDIDRENVYEGRIRFFWNVGRPLVREDAAFCSLHKVGNFGDGFFVRSEGVILRSENILAEPDPGEITWQTLPDGDVGLRTPDGGGPIAEEHSYTSLSDGTIYAIYRTVDGHPVYALSRDNGRNFTPPEYLRYANGRHVKHPRAANFVWRCENGKYLYWYHNHGGRFIAEGRVKHGGGFPYEDRNPVWISAGEEIDLPDGKTIRWSEPEIVLYEDDPHIRMSYPDMIEQDGNLYLTETQKDVARVHKIDKRFLELLFSQHGDVEITHDGCVCESEADESEVQSREIEMPELPRFIERDSESADFRGKDNRRGITLELWFRLGSLDANQSLIDWTDDGDRGVIVRTSGRGTVEVLGGDGQSRFYWDTDPDTIRPGELHHLAIVFDGGPKILTFVVDGRVQDGGDSRQFGWCRFSPFLRGLTGADIARVAGSVTGTVPVARIYNRALMNTECIGNFRAGGDASVTVSEAELVPTLAPASPPASNPEPKSS